jgi:hypothetical protein
MTVRTATTSRRGSILIVAMIVTLTLSASVLVLCRTVRVESMAAANRSATMQADAIARGAEQYVLAIIASEGQNALDLSEDQFAAVPVGEGYFWLLRPNYDDDSLPVFGLVDEAAKLNINYDDDVRPNDGYSEQDHIDRLMRIPGMTEDVAAAIMDWQDENQDPSTSGAEDEYYATLPEPYTTKSDRFETVEELLLVRGMTRQMLYGDGTAPPLGERTSVMGGSFVTDAVLARGWNDLLTCYSRASRPRPGRGPERVRGLINARRAPRAVLLTIQELDDADVDKILAARSGADSNDDKWLSEALGQKYAAVAPQLTTQTLQYSADILAVTANGRAFKRVKMVVDYSRGSTPRVEYRRDITDRGWPMDPAVLASLRAGQGPGSAAIGMRSMGGRL